MSDIIDPCLEIILPILLVVKMVWFLLITIHFILKVEQHPKEHVVLGIQDNVHILYNIVMGVLLVYLYNVLRDKTVCISGKTKEYLFMYGILMIIGNLQKSIHLTLA